MKSKSTLTEILLHRNAGIHLQKMEDSIRYNPLSFNKSVLTLKAMVLLFLFAFFTQVSGQSPYTTVASGNWNADATWSGTGIPAAGSVVTINGGFTVTVTADAACTTLNVGGTSMGQGAGTLVFNSGTTLTVSGNVTMGFSTQRTGTLTMTSGGTLEIGGIFSTNSGDYTFNPGSGTVNYNGGAQTVFDMSSNYNNLTLSGSGAKTLTGITTIGGNLTLSATATATTAGNLTIGGNLSIGSGTTFATGSNFTLGVTGTSSITGTLTLAGTGNKTFTGNTTINSGGVWNETGIAAVNYAGNLQNDGTTFTANTGVHTFTGSAKTISGISAIAIPNLTISGTTTNNGSLTVSTALAGAGTLTNGATGILNFGGSSITPTLAAIAVGNMVNYSGAGQTVKATPYDNLTLSGSGTKTVSAAAVVAGNLTISGTADANLSGSANTANALYFGSSQQVSGIWGASGSGAANISSNFSGTGTITISSGSCTPPAIGLTVGGAGAVCSGSGTNITVALSETGVNYQLRNGVTPVGAPVAGTGGTINLPTGNLTSSATFNVLATIISTSCAAQLTGTAAVTVNAPPDIALTVGGAGALCSGSGTNITVALSENGVNYQLRNGVTPVGSPVAGTGGTINLPTGNLTSGTTFNVFATNNTSSCSAQLTGTAAVTVNALPNIALTVGGAGAVCSGSGTNITVALSESGVNYQLRNGVAPIGAPVTGTAGTINLPTGNLTSATTFNVLATNISTSCAAQLTGTAAVTVNALPNIALTVGGTGSVCSGSGTNITVALSESGVNYQLRNGVTPIGGPVAGTGGTINLPTGNLTSSITFNVLATNASTSCSAQLTGTAAITVNAPPDITLTVGGAGSVCSGSGTNITVSLSEIGVNYQLRNGVTLIGAPVAGTGGTIVIPTGNLTSATTFNVLATNTTSTCSAQLTGTAAVTINAPPNIALTVGGAGAVCTGSGTNITVVLSEVGVDYQLRNGVTTIGAPVAGTGGTISLPTGNLTSGITFNILATNTTSSCFAQLTGTAAVTVNLPPDISLVVGGAGAVCSGSGTNITVALSESGVNYQLRNGVTPVGAPVAGTGGTINLPTGNLTSAVTFNVLATNAVTGSCSAQLTSTATVTVNSLPSVAAIGGGAAAVCVNSATPAFTNATVGGIWSIVPVSGGSASITSGGVVTGLGAGTVAVTYTVTNGCSNSATVLLTVNASITVAPIIGTSTISIGSSTILASTTPGGIWTSGTPTNAIVNSSTGEVTGIAAGTSLITYTVSNGSGCAGTATMLVTVSTVSGIEDLQDNNGMTLKNHPNPFTGNTTISYTLPSDGRVTLSIRTMTGQVVKTILSEMETEGDYVINVEVGDLTSGVYLGTLSLKKNGKEIFKTIRMVKGN